MVKLRERLEVLRAGEMAQSVKCLPCKHADLSSNARTHANTPALGGVQIGSILVSLTGQPGLFGEFRPGLLGERPYLKITSWGVGSGEMA